MKKNFFFYIFIVINIFFLILSIFSFNDLITREIGIPSILNIKGFPLNHANEVMPFKLIGSHEYSYYGILDILLSNISYLNIIFSIFFF